MSSGSSCQRKPGSEGEQATQRAYDALTNLSAYALTLDHEYRRLEDRLVELANAKSGVAELRWVLREREEIAAEREAFRRAVTALREQVTQGPESRP
jgi:hypothetical protein